jgi:hypothetical protein
VRRDGARYRSTPSAAVLHALQLVPNSGLRGGGVSSPSLSSKRTPNPTNRGVQNRRGGDVSVGLGWFEGTYWVPDPRSALRRFERVLEVDLAPRPRGLSRYPNAWQAGDGAWVGFPRDGDQLHFQIKQTAGEQLGETKLRQLATWSDELPRWKFSRVDLAANDPTRRVEVDQVRQAILDGDAVKRVSKFQWVDDLKGAHSLYVGAPSSEHRLRIYDKDREQGAPIGTYGIRWENQCRDAAAGDLVQRYFGLGPWSATTPTPREVMWPVTARLIDFRDRTSSSEPERRHRLDWWEELIGDLPKAGLERDRGRDDLEHLAEWIKTQCGPSLARLLEDPRYGEAFLDQVVADGRRRLGLADVRLDERMRRRA